MLAGRLARGGGGGAGRPRGGAPLAAPPDPPLHRALDPGRRHAPRRGGRGHRHGPRGPVPGPARQGRRRPLG
ncbi:hypothetical protein CCS92_34800, partial [Methylobacterium radiotolerans]